MGYFIAFFILELLAGAALGWSFVLFQVLTVCAVLLAERLKGKKKDNNL